MSSEYAGYWAVYNEMSHRLCIAVTSASVGDIHHVVQVFVNSCVSSDKLKAVR